MASYLSTSSSSACKSYSVDYKRHSTVDINKCLKNGPISNWIYHYHWVDLLARNESKCEFQFIFRIAYISKYTSSHKNLLFLYSMLLYFSSRVQLQVKSPKEIKILLILSVYVHIPPSPEKQCFEDCRIEESWAVDAIRLTNTREEGKKLPMKQKVDEIVRRDQI